MFRTAGFISENRARKIIFFPYLAFYKITIEWILGIELPWDVKIGPGLQIYHGQAIVVNKDVQMGTNCVLRQSTTIGNSRLGENSPVIGNYVDIGSNVCIIGDIQIGDNVVIGAGSVIVKNIPSNSVVVGNPGRVIRSLT